MPPFASEHTKSRTLEFIADGYAAASFPRRHSKLAIPPWSPPSWTWFLCGTPRFSFSGILQLLVLVNAYIQPPLAVPLSATRIYPFARGAEGRAHYPHKWVLDISWENIIRCRWVTIIIFNVRPKLLFFSTICSSNASSMSVRTQYWLHNHGGIRQPWHLKRVPSERTHGCFRIS